MTLGVLQQELSPGGDYYFLSFHNMKFGEGHPLVSPTKERDSAGNFKGEFYSMAGIINEAPDNAGQVQFQCCHSVAVDLKKTLEAYGQFRQQLNNNLEVCFSGRYQRLSKFFAVPQLRMIGKNL